MTLALGVCPCCVPPIAFAFCNVGLAIVLSARWFFGRRSGRIGTLLKWVSYLLGFLVFCIAVFLAALKSSPRLQRRAARKAEGCPSARVEDVVESWRLGARRGRVV